MKSDAPTDWGLPHRFPFLLIDRVVSCDPGRNAVGVRRFEASEPFFTGHFPGDPVVPGVLLCEAVAQMAGIAAGPPSDGGGWRLSAIQRAKFLSPVPPDSEIRVEVEVTRVWGTLVQAAGRVWLGEILVAECGVVLNAQQKSAGPSSGPAQG